MHKTLFPILLLLLLQASAHAKLLQIIHTNDLHSYFVGYKDGRGGYAKLKTKIEELKRESEGKGIEVLHLDAGDFGEGTSFFLTDNGSASLKALGMLGTEVSVIGNHDHMLGGKVLGQQIRRANVKTKFLSANLKTTPEMDLDGIVVPFTDVKKNDISIRVIGLSTAEAHFQYPLMPGFILPPVATGNLYADRAKKEGKELVIALTHIGQKTDVELAKKSSSFDLIVGGHSHDRIEEVLWVKNKAGRQVPIVQAGSHGLVVGSLLIDLQDDGSLKVLNYKLHEIKVGMEEESEMATFVQEAVDGRNQYFGGRWDEVIGESRIPLSGYLNGAAPSGPSCWGEHMAKMTQEAAKADLGLHLANFEGAAAPAGALTLGDLVENFPHFRNYGDHGWEISTFKVNGKVLRIILKALINLKGFGINYYGLNYRYIHFSGRIPYLGNRYWAYNLRVKGKKIQNKSLYTVAIPAEVAFALKAVLPSAVKKVFPGLTSTGQFYWKVMENYVRANSPIECL